MKRVLEDSPVVGYQLFRFGGQCADGKPVVYPKYYIRHDGKTVCTGTAKLSEAKIKVKKMAGEDAPGRKRLTAVEDVRVGTLLDLVIEDYKLSGQKSIADTRGKIDRGLRPYFGEMLAERVDSGEIERWMHWRASRRTYKSRTQERLRPATINRELSLLRRSFQLGYERKTAIGDPHSTNQEARREQCAEGFRFAGAVSQPDGRIAGAPARHHLRCISRR